VRQASLVKSYSRELRRRFGLWPTWLPDAKIAAGDYGRVEKGVFVREGSVTELGVMLELGESRSTSDQLFASEGVRHVLIDGAATEAAGIAVKVRIEFGRSLGVFVGLHKCREERVADVLNLAAQLDDLRGAGRWASGCCVVTAVVRAESALIAVGGDSGGLLDLAATVPAPDLLTLLGGQIRIAGEAGVGYRSLLGAGCTPLSRLSRLSSAGELIMRGGQPVAPRLLTVDARAGLRSR
jgi:hypothetical protein